MRKKRLRKRRRAGTKALCADINDMGKSEFSLQDLLAHESELARLHPTETVEKEIEQQLQILRDQGILEFWATEGTE